MKEENLSETKAESTLVAKETDYVPKHRTLNQLQSGELGNTAMAQ